MLHLLFYNGSRAKLKPNNEVPELGDNSCVSHVCVIWWHSDPVNCKVHSSLYLEKGLWVTTLKTVRANDDNFLMSK